MQTSPTLRRQLCGWLKAGVMDHGELFPTVEGSPQGGCISPLLANIALHGLENTLVHHFPQRPKGFSPPHVVRYADDFVVLHKDRAVVEECQRLTAEWLKEMGLELKPSKTQVVHTLERHEREPGFNFLGFNIRQYRAGRTHSTQYPRGRCLGFTTTIKPSKESVKRHVDKLRDTLHKNRSAEQERVIQILSPKIVGWCAYFATAVCKDVFQTVQSVLFAMLFAWAVRRHPNKGKKWVADKYWRHNDGLGWTSSLGEVHSGSRCTAPRAAGAISRWPVGGVLTTEIGSTGALGWGGNQRLQPRWHDC
jgi:RNA-directed DNA polymerase